MWFLFLRRPIFLLSWIFLSSIFSNVIKCQSVKYHFHHDSWLHWISNNLSPSGCKHLHTAVHPSLVIFPLVLLSTSCLPFSEFSIQLYFYKSVMYLNVIPFFRSLSIPFLMWLLYSVVFVSMKPVLLYIHMSSAFCLLVHFPGFCNVILVLLNTYYIS